MGYGAGACQPADGGASTNPTRREPSREDGAELLSHDDASEGRRGRSKRHAGHATTNVASAHLHVELHQTGNPVAVYSNLGRLPGNRRAVRPPRGRLGASRSLSQPQGSKGSTPPTSSRSGPCARPTGAALGGARAQPLGYRQRQGPPPKVLRRERLESLTAQSLSQRRPALRKPSGPKCLHYCDSNRTSVRPPSATPCHELSG